MFRRASLHFSIGRHKSSFPCLAQASPFTRVEGQGRWRKKPDVEYCDEFSVPINCSSFPKESAPTTCAVCVCVCVHAGTIAGFPFIPETDLRTFLRHYGWDRGETFSKRWWNTFRVTVKRKEEKRESNWPNRVLKRVLRNLPSLCAFLK